MTLTSMSSGDATSSPLSGDVANSLHCSVAINDVYGAQECVDGSYPVAFKNTWIS